MPRKHASPARSDDASRSRSRRKAAKSKQRRERSRSKAAKARSRSVSRRKRNTTKKRSPSRSRSGAKKRSRSRKNANRRQSRSKSPGKKGSPSKTAGKKRSPSKKRVRRSPSRKKSVSRSKGSNDGDKPKAEPENGKAKAPAETAPAAEPVPVAPPPFQEAVPAAPAAPVAPAKQGELVTVTLAEKPFGMAPSKEADVTGYVVAKKGEGKPAEQAGVQIGWRLVEVGSKSCRDLDLEAIQAVLKAVALPAALVFEKPAPLDSDPSDDEDDFEGGDDVLDARAEQRRQHAAALSNIDELPVERSPSTLPDPIKSWQDAVNKGLLNKSLLEKLQGAGLKRPTLIQRHSLPIVGAEFGKYDLIALAQTGSGKTFAFVIPTVARLILQGAMPRPFFPGKSPGCPLMLVLSPTRELAMQTSKEIEVLAQGTNLQNVCVYGGESLKFQLSRVEKNQIDILCATPGRLIDLIDASKVSLSFIQSVVLDEADQMLEQSLEIMCAEILTGRDMPDPKSGRQTLLFSATMPQKIRDLCPKILRQDRIANLMIGHYGDDAGGSCASIKQVLKWIPDESQRVRALIEDLQFLWKPMEKKGRVVIFTNQRLQANMLANALLAQGVSCLHLHGKLDQHVREEMFDKFRRGQCDILVATNVASRGLDFPDISLVVQYNLPQTIDIYTHRIGRTGRVGQVGCALAYVGNKDRHLMPKLIEFLELNKQEIPYFLQRAAAVPGMHRR